MGKRQRREETGTKNACPLAEHRSPRKSQRGIRRRSWYREDESNGTNNRCGLKGGKRGERVVVTEALLPGSHSRSVDCPVSRHLFACVRLNLAEIYLQVSEWTDQNTYRVVKLTLQHGIDHLEGLVDLLTNLGTGEDDLAADEDQEHDFRLQKQVSRVSRTQTSLASQIEEDEP